MELNYHKPIGLDHASKNGTTDIKFLRKQKLSALIIPIQIQIELLEELQTYECADHYERLNRLYREIAQLRTQYFEL